MKRWIALPVVLLVTIAAYPGPSAAKEAAAFDYPKPPVTDKTDTYFGTKVADLYRDLENLDAETVKKWIEAENKLTFDYLERIPERKQIREKLTALWNYEK